MADASINIQDFGLDRSIRFNFSEAMNTGVMPTITYPGDNPTDEGLSLINAIWLSPTIYRITYQVNNSSIELPDILLAMSDAENESGVQLAPFLAARPFTIDTKRPVHLGSSPSTSLINDAQVNEGSLLLEIQFDEACDQNTLPILAIESSVDVSSSIIYASANSFWSSDSTFAASFQLFDANAEADNFGYLISNVKDLAGNTISPISAENIFQLDTKNPVASALNISNSVLNQSNVGSAALIIDIEFDEAMNLDSIPELLFIDQDPLENSLLYNQLQSVWVSSTEIHIVYDLLLANEELFNISLSLENFSDAAGNELANAEVEDAFTIDTKKPDVTSILPSIAVITDQEEGVSGFHMLLSYPEPMNTTQIPLVQIIQSEATSSLALQLASSTWLDGTSFQVGFNVSDQNIELEGLGVTVAFAKDAAGNSQIQNTFEDLFAIDTKNPELLSIAANDYDITNSNIGENGFDLLAVFDETMDQNTAPFISFSPSVPTVDVLIANDGSSLWLNPFTHKSFFDVAGAAAELEAVAFTISGATDINGNPLIEANFEGFLSIFLDPLSASSMNGSDQWSIYPTVIHSGSTLTLRNTNSAVELLFNIYDLNGKKILSQSYQNLPAGSHSVALPVLSAGLYLCIAESGSERFSTKIIIQ